MMAESVDLTENRQTEVLVVAWVMTGAAVMTVGIKDSPRRWMGRLLHLPVPGMELLYSLPIEQVRVLMIPTDF